MPTITISGYSDDLIEIDGDIREEFNHLGPDAAIIAVSDGTLLRVHYDNDGVWRIVPLRQSLDSTIEWTHGTTTVDTGRSRSDKVTVTGPHVQWVAYGSAWAGVTGKIPG